MQQQYLQETFAIMANHASSPALAIWIAFNEVITYTGQGCLLAYAGTRISSSSPLVYNVDADCRH